MEKDQRHSTLAPWTNSELVGVGGTPLIVNGTAKLQLELGGQQYPVEMVVADLRAEGILGLDFLEANQCAINLPHGTIRMKRNDQPIPLHRIRNAIHQTETVSAVLLNGISIIGYIEMEFGAVILGKVPGGIVMIE